MFLELVYTVQTSQDCFSREVTNKETGRHRINFELFGSSVHIFVVCVILGLILQVEIIENIFLIILILPFTFLGRWTFDTSCLVHEVKYVYVLVKVRQIENITNLLYYQDGKLTIRHCLCLYLPKEVSWKVNLFSFNKPSPLSNNHGRRLNFFTSVATRPRNSSGVKSGLSSVKMFTL